MPPVRRKTNSPPPRRRPATSQRKRGTRTAVGTSRCPPRTPSSALLIVGVGASAGGMEAFSHLLEALPDRPGLAIVFVQHLAPQHESALPTLLAGRTRLAVLQATEGMRVERNRVYVIPPNVQMGIKDDVLHLLPRPSDRSQYTPIDYFFHSLAESTRERTVGVILSGTASDGTAGVREIKAVGGITIAQSPESAKYDGMPRAAIASEMIDLVLEPKDIANELVAIAAHPVYRAHATAESSDLPPPQQSAREPLMDQIFAMLRAATGVDFRRYKRPTIDRRLQRRMVLHKLTRLDHYVRLLREKPAEVQALYADILIHVTRFFRDRDTLASVSSFVLPKILAEQTDDQPLRVWIPGCSTGEEAYTVAMLILESLNEQGRSTPVQVFATDVSDPAIKHARSGFYPGSIAADVDAERLRRHFTKVEGGYRINRAVRDVCIFARQDLTRDPPFSKLDLIVCRNVLIYMDVELQKHLMAVFHYALKPTGFLVLGSAETIGSNPELFLSVERRHRLYQKKGGRPPDLHLPLEYSSGPRAGHRPEPVRQDTKSVDGEASRVIQERFAPPGVVVDASFNVVQYRGQTGAYLEPAPGEPSLNVLKMAREGLLYGMREALQQSRRAKGAVSKRKLRVRSNAGWRDVDVTVLPLTGGDRLHYLVLFDEVKDGQPTHRERRTAPRSNVDGAGHERPSRRAARLEQELASSRQYLQSIIQDLEAANEELQSANEEVLSANEELQSTNEELDTAKEELQSTNEELNTVNEELQERNEELSRVNSDLMNLLSSVQIAIVIVASDLHIRRFTPMAERVLNLIPADIGRPISHIKPNIDCPDLEMLITQVIDTVTPVEREVRDSQGTMLSLRIRPYKNIENRIEGAVLALFDAAPAIHEPYRLADEYAATVLEAIDEPAALLGPGQRLRAVNRAFARAFGISAESADVTLVELADGTWSAAAVRDLIDRALGAGPSFGGQITHDFPGLGAKRIQVSGRRLGADGAGEAIAVVVVEDEAHARAQ